ncbi:MAG: imidazole glycerol phosphate synthase subunit HisH [Alphaproteobacteria bacterium]
MNRVAIVDYGLCNLDSVARAVEECGGRPHVTDDPRDLADADSVILPGVGSYGDAMANLREKRLDDAMTERVMGGGAPYLGICLGMQLMAHQGSEGRGAVGLGWIDGAVRKLVPSAPGERVPHIGWNEVEPVANAPLFAGIDSGIDFYFAHGYHLDATEASDVQGRTPYCGGFVSAIAKDNLFGVQFHPEKSQKSGFKLLANFLRL